MTPNEAEERLARAGLDLRYLGGVGLHPDLGGGQVGCGGQVDGFTLYFNASDGLWICNIAPWEANAFTSLESVYSARGTYDGDAIPLEAMCAIIEDAVKSWRASIAEEAK